MTLSLLEKGFDYVDYLNGGYENADSLAALVTTGANSIEASIEYGIDPQTNTVYADPVFTDNLAAYGATIARAVSMGLSVTVRPLIDFVNPTYLAGTSYSFGEWRSYFNPGPAGSAGANAFFASYEQMLLQYAQVGVANGATTLSIGTEIDQITGPAYKPYWDAIISALHTQFPTLKLTYSADWNDDISPWAFAGTGLHLGTGNLATQVSFASELDSLGIDVYAPLTNAAHPTLAQLIAGWTQAPTVLSTFAVTHGSSLINYFESVAAAVGKPLIFSEIGYENATDAASSPAGSSTKVVDSALQAELYQAFFQAWQQAGNSSLTGVYFWNWDPNAAEVGPGQPANFSPQGLPAQGVVTSWFSPPHVTATTDNSANEVGVGHVVKITVTASEVETVTGTPTLQLNDSELATYVGGSGTNTLQFAYVVQPGDHSSDLQVTGLNLPAGATIQDPYGNIMPNNMAADLGLQVNGVFPFTSNADLTEAMYIGYFGRAGDPVGDAYWLNQLNSGIISVSGAAASFSVQAESTALYPFLANPVGASQAQIVSFIDSVYQDLFNRAPDSGGLNYWQNYLSTNAGNPQAVGAFILAVVNGGQNTSLGLDQTTIADKVAVAEYLTQSFTTAGIKFSSSTSAAYAEAHSVISTVTSDATTVTTAEASINAWITAHPAGTAATPLVGVAASVANGLPHLN